jgi:hypothetical protein
MRHPANPVDDRVTSSAPRVRRFGRRQPLVELGRTTLPRRRLERQFASVDETFYASLEREGRLQSAERAVPTPQQNNVTNLLSA